MINDTFTLRKVHGQFKSIVSDNLVSLDHVSSCQACGSNKPERLIAVQSTNGMVLLVGSTCASILTSGKNPSVDTQLVGTGEQYTDGIKEVVYITEEWLKNLGDYIYKVDDNKKDRYGSSNPSNFETDYNGAYYTVNHNWFLDGIYHTARQNHKISIKQFEAVNRQVK